MAKSVEDILEGKEPAEELPKVVEAPVERPEVETEKPEVIEPEAEAPEQETAEPEAKPEKNVNREVGGLKAAQTAERKKRQQAESERDQLRQELDRERASFRQEMAQMLGQFAPKQPEQPKPGVWEDPEAYVQGQTGELKNEIRQRDLYWGEQLARVRHGDDVFDAAEQAAQEAVRVNPGDPVVHLVRNSANPAEALVKWHNERQQLQDLSDPETLIEKQLATASPEFKAKLLGMLGAQPPAPKPTPPAPSALPSNLAGARSVSGSRNKVFSGAPSLDEIVSKGRGK